MPGGAGRRQQQQQQQVWLQQQQVRLRLRQCVRPCRLERSAWAAREAEQQAEACTGTPWHQLGWGGGGLRGCWSRLREQDLAGGSLAEGLTAGQA